MAEPRNQGLGGIPRQPIGELGVYRAPVVEPAIEQPYDMAGAVARIIGGVSDTATAYAGLKEDDRQRLIVAERASVAGYLADFDYNQIQPKDKETLSQATLRTLKAQPWYGTLQKENQVKIYEDVVGGAARLQEQQKKKALYIGGKQELAGSAKMAYDPQQRQTFIKDFPTTYDNAIRAGVAPDEAIDPVRSALLYAAATGDKQMVADLEELAKTYKLGDEWARAAREAETQQIVLQQRQEAERREQLRKYDDAISDQRVAVLTKPNASITEASAVQNQINQKIIADLTGQERETRLAENNRVFAAIGRNPDPMIEGKIIQAIAALGKDSSQAQYDAVVKSIYDNVGALGAEKFASLLKEASTNKAAAFDGSVMTTVDVAAEKMGLNDTYRGRLSRDVRAYAKDSKSPSDVAIYAAQKAISLKAEQASSPAARALPETQIAQDVQAIIDNRWGALIYAKKEDAPGLIRDITSSGEQWIKKPDFDTTGLGELFQSVRAKYGENFDVNYPEIKEALIRAHPSMKGWFPDRTPKATSQSGGLPVLTPEQAKANPNIKRFIGTNGKEYSR